MPGADGSRFGKYRLLKHIAAGGMGEVHLAKLKGPSGFEKLVVIKRLLGHRQGQQKYIDMFFSEARVAAQLSHSNIVQVYEVGNYHGTHYIAMEYVQGKSLRKILDTVDKQSERLSPAYIIQIISELCFGLAAAHDARHLSGAPMGLIHRDVNPHNVLVSYRGEVKVIDFGIAKSELTMDQTQAGTIKGTVVYMSPEQSTGQKLDRRSDLFSVGICLYEALAGTNPFYKDSLTASLEAIRHATIPPLKGISPSLEVFDHVVFRALARNPMERYQDCNELAADLLILLEKGLVPKPVVPLPVFLANLFADDIAEEERLLSQTELADVLPMGETSSIVLSGEISMPQLLGDEKTIADGATMARLPAEFPIENTTQGLDSGFGDRSTASANPMGPPPSKSRFVWWLMGLGLCAGAGFWFWERPTSTARQSVVPSPGPSAVADAQQPNAAAPMPMPQDVGALSSPAPLVPGPLPSVSVVNPFGPDIDRHPNPSVPPPGRRPSPSPKRRATRPRPLREPSAEAAVGGPTVQVHLEPPLHIALNGVTQGPNIHLRGATGIIRIGTGNDAEKDPFIISIRYHVENKHITYIVMSEPWANVFGPGGINVGRTPLQKVEGDTTTVLEFHNPHVPGTPRVTLRFIAP